MRRLSGGPSGVTEGDVTREIWSKICNFAGLKMKEGGHPLRDIGSFEKMEKIKETDFP